jgi:hypothetical protein
VSTQVLFIAELLPNWNTSSGYVVQENRTGRMVFSSKCVLVRLLFNRTLMSHLLQIINIILYFLLLGANIGIISFVGKQTYITPARWAFLIWQVNFSTSSKLNRTLS